MELEVEVEDMPEGVTRDSAHGALADARKDGVEQLAEERTPDTCSAIYGMEIDALARSHPEGKSLRQGEGRGVMTARTAKNERTRYDVDRRFRRQLHIKRVDDVLENERHLDIEQLLRSASALVNARRPWSHAHLPSNKKPEPE